MPLSVSLAEAIRAGIASALHDVHTCTIAQVNDYDAATQRATVWPLIRDTYYDDAAPPEQSARQSFELPALHAVPVVWPRAGGYALHFPLKKGDQVLLVFAESDVGNWRVNAKAAAPQPGADIPPGYHDPISLRRHGLGNAFAIAGIFPDQHPIEDAPTDHAVLIVPAGGRLRVSTASAGHVESVALAEKVAAQLTALKDAISNAAVIANDGGASLKSTILAALADWPGDVASSTLEAEGTP